MSKKSIPTLISIAAVCSFLALPTQAADTHVKPMTEFAKKTVQAWIADPEVIEAVKAQNAKNTGLSQADIDRLDLQWRAETKSSDRPLIDSVLGKDVSRKLKAARNEARGLVTEIFVMDNKGLNVGQSDVTSDYWQGDEAKWKKSYQAGAGAVFIDEVELDESTQTFQSQLSLPVVDPANGEVIGAVTVGVNVDELLQ